MKRAIKQTRGPGMNLGLKKPRVGYIPSVKPLAKSAAMGPAAGAAASPDTSYLPKLAGGGKVKPRKS